MRPRQQLGRQSRLSPLTPVTPTERCMATSSGAVSMTPAQAPFLLRPAKTPTAGPQQSGVIIAHHYGLIGTAFGQAERGQRAIAGPRIEETAMLDPRVG